MGRETHVLKNRILQAAEQDPAKLDSAKRDSAICEIIFCIYNNAILRKGSIVWQ